MGTIYTKYYCFVDAIEINDQEITFNFDGIEKSLIDQLQNISLNFANLIDKWDTVSIIGTILNNNKLTKNNFNIKEALESENKWYIVELTNSFTPFSAQIFINNSELIEPINAFIRYTIAVDMKSNAGRILENNFNLNSFSDSSEEEINEALTHPDYKDKNSVTAYNVGQGNLNAICDINNTPLIYYDLGGGSNRYTSTYPTNFQLCFKKFKTIILSHWDMDHIETLRRLYYKNERHLLKNKILIAPRQLIGPTHYKIAIEFTKYGKILIWPNKLTSFQSTLCTVYKCFGPDKNHSGLAIDIELKENTINRILLPGDAAYMYIPYSATINFDGLVATHHGANFDNNNYPIPVSKNGYIAYSHGNGYGHPTTLSINAHINAGWKTRRETIKGNIIFKVGATNLGIKCKSSLRIKQTF